MEEATMEEATMEEAAKGLTVVELKADDPQTLP